MLPQYSLKVKANLKKMIGMLNRIQKMVDEDRYCVDIAQQVNATMGFLRQTNNVILENHLNTCGGNKLNAKNQDERQKFIQELIRSFTITNK